MLIDVRPDLLDEVKKILKEFIPDYAVYAFGSRVKWTAKDTSDLDLCIKGNEKLNLSKLSKLQDAFSLSRIPYKVDVVDYHRISESFRNLIEPDWQLLSSPTKKWPSIRLADACVKEGGIQTGPFGSQLHQKDYVETGTPIITVEHLGDNRITSQNLPRITNEDRIRLKKYSLKVGDIVFSRVGSVDRRALVRQEEDGWLFSGRCLRVRLDETKADPAFISFQFGLESFKEYIRSIAVGATMPSLNTQILSNVQIILPSLTEQKTIAAVLSALDDKIELNRKMNETLEAMAKALFKSWFVDFDPVRAKAEGLKPEGLAPEMADLFPDGFEDSELGEIPRGWKIVSLPDIIEINPRRILSKASEAPYIEMSHLSINSSSVSNWRIREFTSGSKFTNGDTLLARITPCLENGKTAFVDCLPENVIGWGSTEFIVLFSKPPFPPEFSYLVARSESFREFAIANMTGSSGRQRVPDNCLFNFKIAKAPNPVLINFSKFLDPLFKKILASHSKTKILIQIRDALLPKLMSGEIRVKESEKIAEAII